MTIPTAKKIVDPNIPIIGETFESRRDAFLKETVAAGKKHQVAVIPGLDYASDGVRPQMVIVDAKPQQKTPQKDASASEGNSSAKNG